MSERLATLAEIADAVWLQLDRAAREPDHEWRTPVLATIDGDIADARTVVLREVDAVGRQLVFYSDARAAKVTQLSAHPRATVVMWSRALGWQLRCRVELGAETAGLAVASRWASVKLTRAANDYLSALPPGSTLDGTQTARPPQPDRATRGHFAIVNAEVVSIDWLELHRLGHRRALFSADSAAWLQA